jgi:hypothetical protein
MLFALHKATNAMVDALKQAESELFLGQWRGAAARELP